MGTQLKAIDVSHWRKVDYSRLPDEINLVIIKATEGIDFIDPRMVEHIEGARGAGREIGLYHFFRTNQNPIEQALFFVEVCKPYWEVCNLRINDFEKSHMLPNGEWYNPKTGTIEKDLKSFHMILKDSGWSAYDLIYTGLGTWQDWGLENYKNGWQGPDWINSEKLIDGLWIAAWNVAIPVRLPRPFKGYDLHQITNGYMIEGITTESDLPSGVDLNISPYSLEQWREKVGWFVDVQQGTKKNADWIAGYKKACLEFSEAAERKLAKW